MDDKKRRDNQEEKENREAEIEEEKNDIESELQKVRELAGQLDNQLKRSLADYQNLQRRTQEEKAEWIRMANKDLVLKFLPVLDTLMLAQRHIQDKGLDLSIDQFLQAIYQEGVKRIETVGEEFNPQIMEAVSTKEEKGMKGKVVEEMRAGYMFGDTVLRAAQVIVGQ